MAQPAAVKSASDDQVEQHSLPATIAYHLLPGVVILVVAIAFVPIAKAAGFPPIVGLLVAMLFAGLPVQLGYLLRLGWKRNGRLSLAKVVVYRHRVPRWQDPLYAVATVAWGAVVTFAATPIESAILKRVFGWVPAGFTATTAADAASYSTYPRTILLITFGSLILINGVAAPIIEELYFRGYLMPRISRFRWKTPILEDALFALYHIWQPWAYVIILLTMISYIAPVFRRRNIYIGVWAHMSLNLLGNTALLGLILR
jgi:membrane protease YdiL (CAAX protease family)